MCLGHGPRLKIGQLEMIYGERDWMDVRHGNEVANATSQSMDRTHPTVVVQLIDAGRGSQDLTRKSGGLGTVTDYDGLCDVCNTHMSFSITVHSLGKLCRKVSPELCKRDRVSDFPLRIPAIQIDPNSKLQGLQADS